MKLKPLLLIIPCLVVISFLFIIDKPLPEKKTQSNKSTSVVKENVQKDDDPVDNSIDDSDGDSDDHPEDHPDNKPIDPSDFIHMKLVVGKTGSLRAGGYEPIYIRPDPESEVIGKLEFNCAVIETEEQLEEEWVCVDLKGRGEGYVNKDNVELVEASFGSEDPLRNQIIRDAIEYLGLRFVRYGKSLTDGIDCSNFLQQIYKKNGISIPVKPKDQRNYGKIISEENLQAADIIYYDKANNGTGHVGLYLGDGFIINSSGHSGKSYPEGGVRIVRLLYPDRTSYQVVTVFREESETSSEKEESTTSSEKEESTTSSEKEKSTTSSEKEEKDADIKGR